MMNCYIKAPCKEQDYFFFEFKINDTKIEEWLGDYVQLELLSGDYLFVEEGYKDYEKRPNHAAAALCGEPVYGDCIILERDDYV
jgi:hypothetical protein